MIVDRECLYSQSGRKKDGSWRSDKVYHIEIHLNEEDRYSVVARWGRRGTTLQSETKCSEASRYFANSIYLSLLQAKIAKGYQTTEMISGVNMEAASVIDLTDYQLARTKKEKAQKVLKAPPIGPNGGMGRRLVLD